MDDLIINSLVSFPVFRDIKDDATLSFLRSIPSKKFQTGQIIVSYKDQFRGVLFIKNGLVKMYKNGASGKESIIGLGNSGSTFAIESVINKAPYLNSIEALFDTEVYFLSHTELVGLFSSDKNLLFGFIKELCLEVNYVENRLNSLLNKKTSEQIAEVLITCAKAVNKEKDIIDIRVSEISKIIGTTNNYAHKIIKDLVRTSAIKMEGKKIRILNWNKLCSFAGTDINYV
ncbi:MAG: Crp/Fnr family transcriptional regulator [Bacteroidia bacterium]|nr:Crp/Fnr family transcriptional regulator [Bacteroidia bacterium]